MCGFVRVGPVWALEQFETGGRLHEFLDDRDRDSEGRFEPGNTPGPDDLREAMGPKADEEPARRKRTKKQKAVLVAALGGTLLAGLGAGTAKGREASYKVGQGLLRGAGRILTH